MATEIVFFKGKGAFVNAHKIDQYGKWSMKLYPDAESLTLFKKLQDEKGIQNELSKDDDGWFFRLGRKASIRTRRGEVGQNPPMVFDGTKPLPGGGYAPLLEPIGHGSDVIAKVELYQFNVPGPGNKRGWAMKWHSLRVDNLVPYDNKSFNTDELAAVEGFDKQPKQLF